MKSQNSLLSLLLFLSVILFSCKHEEDVTRWDTNILAPLLHSSIGLNNLVADSLLSKKSDNSLSLVYKNTLYKATIDSLFKIPDTSATSSAKLETLVLKDVVIPYSISLGAIAKQTPGIGPFIIASNGSYSMVPAFGPVASGNIPVDAGKYFETMTLKNGTLVVRIQNQLPVDITNVIFRVVNQSDNSVVVSDTFPLIKTQGIDSISTSLAGKTINKNLIAKLVSLSSPGSNGKAVKIDTSNALVTTLTIKNLKPLSATAVFPAQNLIDNVLKPVALSLPEVQLGSVNLRHGDIVMTAYSTLQDSLYLTYSIPSATLGGTMFLRKFVIPPAPKGVRSALDLKFDFTGYTLNLANGIGYNTLNTQITASIQYTGKIKTLSLSDSIYFHVGFTNLLPDYAKGYLGKKTINLNNTVPFSLFGKISSGTLTLQNVSFKLHFENGIGVDENFTIKNITAINTRTKSQLGLSGSIVGSQSPITLSRATEAPGTSLRVIPTVKDTSLTPANSNIKSIVESLPDKLHYELTASLNPNGNNSGSKDFVYYGTGISASLNMEIPLNLIANKLELRDTVAFSFATIDAVKNKKIVGGQMTLLSDNGFPFDATIQVYLLDGAFNKMDSLVTNNKIEAAPVDASNKVTVKKRSNLIIPITGKLEKLKKTSNILIVASFSSIPSNTLLKIYSDYTIDFKLIGDFTYGIK
jgi:hypothetical protein